MGRGRDGHSSVRLGPPPLPPHRSKRARYRGLTPLGGAAGDVKPGPRREQKAEAAACVAEFARHAKNATWATGHVRSKARCGG